MKRIRVMQITDTLNAAGRERMAVNLANLLHANGYMSYLCTTRSDGPLEAEVHAAVGRLRLARTHRADLVAVFRLVRFLAENQIDIVHAHEDSLFISGLASLFPPYPLLVWHDHYGALNLQPLRSWIYRLGTMRASGVISCSEELAEWARISLNVPAARIWYLPSPDYARDLNSSEIWAQKKGRSSLI